MRMSSSSAGTFGLAASLYGFSLSMLTTLVPVIPVHAGSGAILTITALMGSAQTVQGPVQKVDSFLGMPLFVVGVKSHTLAPGRKLLASLWYWRLCLLTAPAMFSLAYFWAESILSRSFLR
jgi:hypothetical protein